MYRSHTFKFCKRYTKCQALIFNKEQSEINFEAWKYGKISILLQTNLATYKFQSKLSIQQFVHRVFEKVGPTFQMNDTNNSEKLINETSFQNCGLL